MNHIDNSNFLNTYKSARNNIILIVCDEKFLFSNNHNIIRIFKQLFILRTILY